MIKPSAWTARTFTFDLPIGAFPAVLERLRGTPARATELVSGVSEEVLGRRSNGKWSAKENLGHLVDLHALDVKRLAEYLAGAEMLFPGDITNRATEAAKHNDAPIGLILARMRKGRIELALGLEALSGDEVGRVALHPRLQQPMRLLDWAYFVAEHDDYHLARARLAIREVTR